MTTTTLAAAILRDVPRYFSSPGLVGMVKDGNGGWVRLTEVLAALTAALDGVDERAGRLLPDLQKAMVPYDPEIDAQEYWETLCSLSADLITALLAQNAALRAQQDVLADELHTMKTGGIIEVANKNNRVTEYMFHWEGRALDAEAEVEKLREAMIQMRDDKTGFRHAVHFRRFITAALTKTATTEERK